MKILTFGCNYYQDADDAQFKSYKSILGYDVAIFNFEEIAKEFNYLLERNSNAQVLKNYENMKSIIDRRKNEIKEFLKFGNTLIIYVGSSLVYNFKIPSSGGFTEYNLNLYSVLPLEISLIEAHGEKCEYKGNKLFESFWNCNKKNIKFYSYFQKSVGEPLWVIEGTDKVVGSHLPYYEGNIIFMPMFEPVINMNVNKIEENRKYYESIIELTKDINKSTNEIKTPEWCTQYLLPNEDEGREYLKKYEEKLIEVKKRIENQKKMLEYLEKYKILFSGTGRELEIQVGNVFSELGFEVAEGLPGRDDLILKYKDMVAVVEVKGVSKSAAERHAAQLEKWVMDYYCTKEIKPKGILVVNAYKDKPLSDRKEDVFPNQMLPLSTSREHCLISGLQLLGLYLKSKENPKMKDELIEKLFNTAGVFEEFSDWKQFINVYSSDEK